MKTRYTMKLNAIALALALAYGGAAFAGSNEASIDQTGSGNTASID